MYYISSHDEGYLLSLTWTNMDWLYFPALCTLCQSVKMWATQMLYALFHIVTLTVSAPSGFPASGNGLWFTKPADPWASEWLPVGNGYLAGDHINTCFLFLGAENWQAMVPGGTFSEVTQLNIESLWSGGPFAEPVGPFLL